MKVKCKTSFNLKTIVLFLLLLCLNISLTPHTKPGTVNAELGRTIDVFTQKAPFDGKGPNSSSDMFGPQEVVKLYALVLKCGSPLTGKLVTFKIRGPINAS